MNELPKVGDRFCVQYAGDNGCDFITVIALHEDPHDFIEVEFQWDDDESYEVMDADEFMEWEQLTKVRSE